MLQGLLSRLSFLLEDCHGGLEFDIVGCGVGVALPYCAQILGRSFPHPHAGSTGVAHRRDAGTGVSLSFAIVSPILSPLHASLLIV